MKIVISGIYIYQANLKQP